MVATSGFRRVLSAPKLEALRLRHVIETNGVTLQIFFFCGVLRISVFQVEEFFQVGSSKVMGRAHLLLVIEAIIDA